MKLPIVLVASSFVLMMGRVYAQVLNTNEAPFLSIHLSIDMTNTVFTAGSTNFLRCKITNSSTKASYMDKPIPQSWGWTEVSLFDQSNVVYSFTDSRLGRISRRLGIQINPGEVYEYGLSLSIKGKVAPGHYHLGANELFLIPISRTNSSGGKLESNLLDVSIAK